MGLQEVGRFVMTAGAILFFVGIVLSMSGESGSPRFWGSFHMKFFGGELFIPVVTIALVSIVLLLLVNIFSR